MPPARPHCAGVFILRKLIRDRRPIGRLQAGGSSSHYSRDSGRKDTTEKLKVWKKPAVV
jgi:hypothetical protein